MSKSKESYDVNSLENKLKSENTYGSIRNSGRNQYLDLLKAAENKPDAEVLNIPQRKQSKQDNTKRKSRGSLEHPTQFLRKTNVQNNEAVAKDSFAVTRSSVETKPGAPVKEVIKKFERRSCIGLPSSNNEPGNGRIQNNSLPKETHHEKINTCNEFQKSQLTNTEEEKFRKDYQNKHAKLSCIEAPGEAVNDALSVSKNCQNRRKSTEIAPEHTEEQTELYISYEVIVGVCNGDSEDKQATISEFKNKKNSADSTEEVLRTSEQSTETTGEQKDVSVPSKDQGGINNEHKQTKEELIDAFTLSLFKTEKNHAEEKIATFEEGTVEKTDASVIPEGSDKDDNNHKERKELIDDFSASLFKIDKSRSEFTEGMLGTTEKEAEEEKNINVSPEVANADNKHEEKNEDLIDKFTLSLFEKNSERQKAVGTSDENQIDVLDEAKETDNKYKEKKEDVLDESSLFEKGSKQQTGVGILGEKKVDVLDEAKDMNNEHKEKNEDLIDEFTLSLFKKEAEKETPITTLSEKQDDAIDEAKEIDNKYKERNEALIDKFTLSLFDEAKETQANSNIETTPSESSKTEVNCAKNSETISQDQVREIMSNPSQISSDADGSTDINGDTNMHDKKSISSASSADNINTNSSTINMAHKIVEASKAKHLSLTTIREIKSDVDKLKEAVEIFEGRKDDVQYVYLNEMLVRCQLKLDNVNVGADDEIRKERKSVTLYVQECMKELDDKAEEGESDIQVSF